MSQTFKGDRGFYTTGKEIGKGGEGCVYEVTNDDKLVLKLYSEVLPPIKIRKLKMMASTNSAQLDGFTAWVKDVVTDSTGRV
jgi:DNA-binding helix-hairpin-helix protein with protein kinase domain